MAENDPVTFTCRFLAAATKPIASTWVGPQHDLNMIGHPTHRDTLVASALETLHRRIG